MAEETILIADDDAAIRTILEQALSRAGFQVRLTSNVATLWRWASRGDGDLIITDVVMPDDNIFNVLPRIKNVRPDLPVLVMSAQNTFMTAITASERGAYDYLPKPFDLRELVSIVERALAERSTSNRAAPKPQEAEDIPLVGRSSAMQEIYRVLARLMQNDLTVLIEGESGTGKELVARALHDYGKRKSGPFVAINMAAIPRELIEAELFGYEKGAFTGATSRGSGRFEQAEAGTLFLDEIGDMPMDAQTRLLRVLQQGEYMTVGGRKSIKTDVRIIAATNKDLHALISEGRFREDLYYRLNVIPIRLPALRNRLDDVDDLVRHFLNLAAKEGLGSKQVDGAALLRMKQHNWPGNVRELENVVRRLAALYPQDLITQAIVDHELGRVAPGEADETDPVAGTPPQDISVMIESLVKAAFVGGEQEPSALYHTILHRVERPLISATLAQTGGNQIKAADILGLNRNTLRKKIKELGVQIIKTAS